MHSTLLVVAAFYLLFNTVVHSTDPLHLPESNAASGASTGGRCLLPTLCGCHRLRQARLLYKQGKTRFTCRCFQRGLVVIIARQVMVW